MAGYSLVSSSWIWKGAPLILLKWEMHSFNSAGTIYCFTVVISVHTRVITMMMYMTIWACNTHSRQEDDYLHGTIISRYIIIIMKQCYDDNIFTSSIIYILKWMAPIRGLSTYTLAGGDMNRLGTPSKHENFIHCRFNVGSGSKTVA